MDECIDVEIPKGDFTASRTTLDGWVGIREDCLCIAEEIIEHIVLDILSRQGFTVKVLDCKRLSVWSLRTNECDSSECGGRSVAHGDDIPCVRHCLRGCKRTCPLREGRKLLRRSGCICRGRLPLHAIRASRTKSMRLVQIRMPARSRSDLIACRQIHVQNTCSLTFILKFLYFLTFEDTARAD